VNEHALAVLEFPRALESVAARAGSGLGKEAVLGLKPGTEGPAIREELARVEELLRFMEARPGQGPPAFPDARGPLRSLGPEGAVLDGPAVLTLLRLMVSTADLHRMLRPDAEPVLEAESLPRVLELRGRLTPHPELEEDLDRVVDEEGEVRDGASPALRSIRRRLRAARSRMVEKLERYLETLPNRLRVPDASVSVRDGRYVIPIRREGKSEVGGIIHGESSTGATLFVEPPLAIRLMNEVQELEREEHREIQRILTEVTGRLRAVRASLSQGLETLVEFDSLWARARTATAWDAAVPEMVEEEGEPLRIVGGRHPLLLEQTLTDAGPERVVPFDLELESDERAVVVSGPNTGGKTVLLKSMGLIQLLAQSGIVPPVGRGSRLPVVKNVLADIGDEQSIAQSLSTFSAHLANAIEILEEAGPGVLVLMDEMGTGTDPAEGAALARAILETLVERGARALVTSHLGALKRLDGEGTGIVNASLRFDSRRIAPTYELQKGRPGRSYGLAIARRLGVPEEVLARAEAYTDSGELEVESLLARLEQKERELTTALARSEEARARAERLEAEAQDRERRLEERERTAEQRAREQARQLLMDARREVEEAIEDLRRSDGSRREEAERRARGRVEEAARRQGRAVPRRARRPESAPPTDVAPGTRVRVLESGTRGRVTAVEEDRVTLEVGGLRLEVPLSGVEPVAGPANGEERSVARGGGQGSVDGKGKVGGGWSGPDVEASHEADLRGLRVDEVELELGRALDGAVMANLHELRVIHGKGTGAVKARVRELLRDDRRVSEFRDGRHGEGGSGVTVVRLA
jgi:DNA mismatch repair protein MutS2